MGKKYFIFPVSYDRFDFGRLFSECTDGKTNILWAKNKTEPKNIEVGDICYLYYTNLPDRTSRIILRGEITNTEAIDTDGSTCYAISKLRTINWENSPKWDFTYKNLSNKYNVKMNLNKRQLKDERDGDKELINKLEKYYNDRRTKKLSLEELSNEFERKLRCALDGKPGDIKKHATFTGRNGLDYYETHHLIKRSICKKAPSLEEYVYDERNLVLLCPACHKEIHYGKKERVRKMLERLYKKNVDFYDSNIQKYTNGKSILEWLFDMYDVK